MGLSSVCIAIGTQSCCGSPPNISDPGDSFPFGRYVTRSLNFADVQYLTLSGSLGSQYFTMEFVDDVPM